MLLRRGMKQMDFKPGYPHISKDPARGYVERDPVLDVGNGVKLPGEHGLMDIRAEVARAAYDAGMLANPVIQGILKGR